VPGLFRFNAAPEFFVSAVTALSRSALRFTLLLSATLSALWMPTPVQAQGAAVITLVMPVGARQLGMGEAAVAISDDVFGTYWNPAGLAFGPVSNEWELMLPGAREGKPPRAFTTVATRPRTGFLVRPAVWVGAADGLAYFDGRRWRTDHEHVLDQGEKIEGVVRRYTGGSGNIDSLAAQVRAYNDVKSKEEEEELIVLKIPYDLLFPGQTVTALALDNVDRLWVGTATGLYRFDGQGWKIFDREEGFTYLPAVAALDSAARARAGANTTEGIEGAVSDSSAVAAAPVDAAASPFRALAVTALAVKGTTLWIGTNDGLYEYRQNNMYRRGNNILPSQYITSIAVHESVEDVYVGLQGKGVARYRPPRTSTGTARWRVYTQTTDGLLDDDVRRVLVDRFGHVYTAHAEGVSHFTLRSWEKIRFRGQQVRSLALDEKNRIWVATSEGAWQFTPTHATPKGRKQEEKDRTADAAATAASSERMGGTWEHYHSGNGLADKNVISVQAEGSDVWFLTGAGVERYHNAKTQVGFFYETLLPALNLDDLYHAYMAASFPIEEWGTIGGFVNYISFGKNLTTGDEGTQASFNAYELVAGLTYATRLNKNAGIGLNAKFIYSALSRGVTSSGEQTDGIAASYAVDAGFLQKNLFGLEGLSFGLMMQNMGPAVFYVDQAQSDPIPFTWKVGLAYLLINRPSHRLIVAGDLNREAFYRAPGSDEAEPFWIGSWKAITTPGGSGTVMQENLRQTVYNSGAEYVYANVVAVRAGYLLDIIGERRELDIGLGFMLSDILQIDGTFIRSFDNGIRNGQQRYSMIMRF
jgi:ligand-binding sensor domain-containing protein